MNVIDGEFYVGRHGKIRQFSGFVVSSFSDVFTDLAFDPPPPREVSLKEERKLITRTVTTNLG